MPQPIWPTCIAFRHKLQSITQAEINACHLGYARSMRAMHHLYVPPCFLQQSPSLTFFASHPSYVNFCFCFFVFFFLLFKKKKVFDHRIILVHYYSSTHRFENTVSKIPDFRGFETPRLYLWLRAPPSWNVYRYLLPSQKINFLLSARFLLEST